MDDTKSGMGWAGLLLFFVVIWILFGSMFNGGFGGNRAFAAGEMVAGGCNRVSNCEVEKQGIIDTARTQYLIETSAHATQDIASANARAIMDQNSRIYDAQQAAALFDAKMEIQSLKSQIFTQAQTDAISRQLADCCCNINRRLDHVECDMLKRPNLFGIASTCSGQIIPPVTSAS